MNYEIRDCIDAGTEYCPCHLAESGDCILCSQLCGKSFCDCVNWKGVCIYQEYFWNGNKAKGERKSFSCSIVKKEIINDSYFMFHISVTHKMAQDLVHPGSYVFLRKEDTVAFYDTPISVMDVDLEENIIKVVIESKGIKTKELLTLNENDKVLLRGPYWNGVLGLKSIYKCRDSNVLLIARGIGQAPLIPVIKKLYSNGNNIFVILDTVNYNDTFIQEYLNMCSAKVMKVPILKKGELTEEFKKLIKENIIRENIKLIHVDAQDIIIYELLENLENNEIKLTCCNNAKMCCGEGICGTCSVRYKGHVVKRLCKLQTEPEYIFKDRRLI